MFKHLYATEALMRQVARGWGADVAPLNTNH